MGVRTLSFHTNSVAARSLRATAEVMDSHTKGEPIHCMTLGEASSERFSNSGPESGVYWADQCEGRPDKEFTCDELCKCWRK